MASVVHPVVRPLMQSKARAILRAGFTPTRSDGSTVVSSGTDPDRILLVGNGALTGWGVPSHDQAIPGHLVRELAQRTAKATEIDLAFDAAATVETAVALLDALDLSSFDAVVLVIGVSDALQLLQSRRWAVAIGELVGTLVERTSDETEIVVMGIQPPSSVPMLRLAVGGLVDQKALELNEITRRLERARVHYLRPPALERVGPQSSGLVDQAEISRVSLGYHAWALTIADTLARLRAANRAWAL